MGSSRGFGSTACNLFAPFALAFATAPPAFAGLTLPHTVTRGLIMQKANGHPDLRDHHSLQAHDFRYYFTPLTGVLFTFPSRY